MCSTHLQHDWTLPPKIHNKMSLLAFRRHRVPAIGVPGGLRRVGKTIGVQQSPGVDPNDGRLKPFLSLDDDVLKHRISATRKIHPFKGWVEHSLKLTAGLLLKIGRAYPKKERPVFQPSLAFEHHELF